MKIDIRLLGLLADGRFHSGTSLAKSLAVTRAAVWKRIAALKNTGIDIFAVKGKGYRLNRPLEFLQQEKICSALPAAILPEIRNVTVLHDIDSTNSYLLSQINSDNFHGHAVLSEFQTAGRGRRGSQWISPFASGICLSIGWHYPEPVDLLSLLSLAAGVAVMHALKDTGIHDAGLKWPNDIYWQDRKLGGILVESRMETAGPCNTVVGVGLNYALPASAGQHIDHPWVDITTIKNPVPSRNRLAAALIAGLAATLARLESHCLDDIINTWRQYDCMKGKHAELLLPDRHVHGIVRGIDDDGALLFAEGDLSPRRYHAGEISLRSAS